MATPACHSPSRRLVLASVSGFCQGVEHALQLFDEALRRHGAPIHLLHELVHNRHVTEEMARRGAVFVSDLDEVPDGSVLLLGAHGVSRRIEEEAGRRRLRAVLNATCPFVARLHRLAASLRPDEDLVLYGQPGHPEAIGIIGHAGTERCHIISGPEDATRLGPLHRPMLLIQTTMSHESAERVVAAMRGTYPDLRCVTDVCHASRQRQAALEQLCREAAAIVVIGSPHSANANRLVEVARAHGRRAWLVENADSLPPDVWRETSLGLIGGASVPPDLLLRVRDALLAGGFATDGNPPD